jgi:hypothetical protein
MTRFINNCSELPLGPQRQPDRVAREGQQADSRSGHGVILVIDDEPIVHAPSGTPARIQ